MGCAIYYRQLHNIENDLRLLDRAGVSEGNPVYDELYRQRGSLIARLGQKTPRVTIFITHEEVLGRLHALGLEYAGGSPGFTIQELENAFVRIWYDIETGWSSEGRLKPSSPPVYRRIEFDEAVAFIKHEESPAMIAHALGEEEYFGE